MIFKKPIGEFTLTVSDPTPRWITIEHEGGVPLTINERELSDLKYLLECAQRECDNK